MAARPRWRCSLAVLTRASWCGATVLLSLPRWRPTKPRRLCCTSKSCSPACAAASISAQRCGRSSSIGPFNCAQLSRPCYRQTLRARPSVHLWRPSRTSSCSSSGSWCATGTCTLVTVPFRMRLCKSCSKSTSHLPCQVLPSLFWTHSQCTANVTFSAWTGSSRTPSCSIMRSPAWTMVSWNRRARSPRWSMRDCETTRCSSRHRSGRNCYSSLQPNLSAQLLAT
mmetsp:Transcript_8895/g.25414  ORF Transcript_8895/g.25414 Transcript_8895/m.25414 type:complete len:225 (-) Transcript_8895:148-822(-)